MLQRNAAYQLDRAAVGRRHKENEFEWKRGTTDITDSIPIAISGCLVVSHECVKTGGQEVWNLHIQQCIF